MTHLEAPERYNSAQSNSPRGLKIWLFQTKVWGGLREAALKPVHLMSGLLNMTPAASDRDSHAQPCMQEIARAWPKFGSQSWGKGKGKWALSRCFLDSRMYVSKLHQWEWHSGKSNGTKRDKYWYLTVSFYNNSNGTAWIQISRTDVPHVLWVENHSFMWDQLKSSLRLSVCLILKFSIKRLWRQNPSEGMLKSSGQIINHSAFAWKVSRDVSVGGWRSWEQRWWWEKCPLPSDLTRGQRVQFLSA